MDEHLSELAFMRLELDPPASDPTFFARATDHLAGCAACRAERDRLSAIGATITLAPKTAPRRERRFSAIVATLALAAGVAVIVGHTPHALDDTWRAKSLRLEVVVHVHDGRASRTVHDGDSVRPGDKAGFAVRAREAGWLLVFGQDDRGVPYPVWPAVDRIDDATAQPIAASAQAEALPAAIAFDAALGDERLTFTYCPVPFTFATRPAEGCVSRTVLLHKRP